MYVCIYTYIHTCMHASMHACTYKYLSIMCVLNVCLHSCFGVSRYTVCKINKNIHIHIYTYAYAYCYRYIHIFTNKYLYTHYT